MSTTNYCPPIHCLEYHPRRISDTRTVACARAHDMASMRGEFPDDDISDKPFAATDPMPLPRQPAPSSRDHAAELLIAPSALISLSLVEAKIVVSYMHPETVPAGETFITEGDAVNTGFMVLLLQGEVLVENITVSRTKPVTVTVLGPGSLIGEMGLLDTGPRSASCTASTNIHCAVLTRDALEALIKDQPAMGAKFLLAVSARIAERYRETQKKLVLFARLASTMQQELDRQN